ncbi:ubiE/COQ5 methyltransferase family protein [Mycobacterium ulcerans str. Harvey]|uniref:UbiE/COQ5 methyltransferase family protein n=1 Tax=Mycobacterium ulcerans str. Harvey TaxID=1299332 RepID=A0ABP3ARS4_MYCUL|nr:ubiE/COQ5 methyltransferase family protein [Mycobacterium ulcerans str. Harvey]
MDLGAGYGGCARHLASDYGSSVTCLNISEAQNETNRERNRNAGLDAKIRVVHGSFEAIPEPDGSYDVVWSQDAILHAADRRKVIEEAFRVLKAGGELIFTDPMQADEVPDGVLAPVYDRLNLADLGSMRFYRETALAVGFEVVDQIDLVHNLGVHYQRVLEELETRRRELEEHSSTEYLDKMRVGLRNWMDSAREGTWPGASSTSASPTDVPEPPGNSVAHRFAGVARFVSQSVDARSGPPDLLEGSRQ